MMKSPFLLALLGLVLCLFLPIEKVNATICKAHQGQFPVSWFSPTIKGGQGLWQGQWKGVSMFITDSDIRFCWLNPLDTRAFHDADSEERLHKKVRGHALFLSFPGSAKIHPEQVGNSWFTVNYHLKNNNSLLTQATNAWLTKNLWPGVDYRLEAKDERLKSTFFLKAGVSPEVIKWRYEGANQVLVHDNRLIINMDDGRIEEQQPMAFQIIDGRKVEIPVAFQIVDGSIGFKLLGRYNPIWPLVLDPTLVFASYSGSLADNWGFTATPGPEGRLYSGGIVFGSGFPTTPGAFQSSFQGGTGSGLKYDVALLAFSSTGDSLIWATYLGGSGNEQPHSMVVNFSDTSLYVMGTTNSMDFPVTKSAWDTSHNGSFDLFVAHFSSTGKLINATFLGGTSNDGINEAPDLLPNYGDNYRGEIILDNLGRVVVGSCTKSSNFPIIQGSYPTGLRAAQDGIVSVLSPRLDQLLVSVVVGAEGEEAVFSIKPLPSPSTSLVLGMVTNGRLPMVSQSPFTQKPGLVDGYVALLSGDGKTLRASTWFGSPLNDWVFFVETGPNGDIYLNGQNNGPIPRRGSSYHVPQARQFIACFDSTLTQIRWSGNYGSGRDSVDLVPTAFLVDDCGKVYISGSTGKISIPQIEGPRNLPLTADSLMGSANGYDFYMACWSAGFDSLLFSTYYGGPISQEHVDGGTSRFDKQGVIYQSVCAGCGGRSDFPVSTNPIVSRVNRAGNCNNAVIKLAFEKSNPIIADFSFSGNQPLCAPFVSVIKNQTISLPGTSWLWSTSNGQQSTDSFPSFIFNQPGSYTITLRATNLLNCNRASMIAKQLTVNANPSAFLALSDTCACEDNPVSLIASDGYLSYEWTGPINSSEKSFTVNKAGRYLLTVSDSNGCKGMDSVSIQLVPCNGEQYNVFTPNGDGANDGFHPIPAFKESASWSVWNRWGQEVFKSAPDQPFWNGKYQNQGESLEASVYFYQVRVAICGKWQEWRGRVMLLR